jgi:hypothetical protein
MPALDPKLAKVAWAKQTTKGTPSAAATKVGRWVDGDLTANVSLGSEEYADGRRLSNATDFVDNISGQGAPGIQAQGGTLAHLIYLWCGQEVVTGVGPYTHTATPGDRSFWATFWKQVGVSPVVQYERHSDIRISSCAISGSSGAKVVRVTPNLVGLRPGEKRSSFPATTDEGTNPFLYTQGQGTFTIDGTVYRGHSAFTITPTDELSPWYGDDVYGHELIEGRGTVQVAATILVDADGLALRNKLIYGTTTPADGDFPAETIPTIGNYSFTLTNGAESFTVTVSGVRWSTDLQLPPNPGGGAVELNLQGTARLDGSDPMIQFVTVNDDPAYT